MISCHAVAEPYVLQARKRDSTKGFVTAGGTGAAEVVQSAGFGLVKSGIGLPGAIAAPSVHHRHEQHKSGVCGCCPRPGPVQTEWGSQPS